MTDRLNLMFVFGTRPEAIKLAPVILAARKQPDRFETTIVATAQHREMLDDVLRAFGLRPNVDLNIMTPNQTLGGLTGRLFTEMETVLTRERPDIVIVQGDTTTVFAAAVSAYYARIPVAHVEAGLRSGSKWAPFPEEVNRRIASAVVDYNFAPTESARRNLLREGHDDSTIHVTGNTVIDALLWMTAKVGSKDCPISELADFMDRHERVVLITGHRRENFGDPFRNICNAFRQLSKENPDVGFVYPVHLNPNVQGPVRDILHDLGNFRLLPPVSYPDFVWLMQRCYFIITDSGGVQEESPALAKPVLVTRRVTERPEAVEAGAARLVGDDPEAILRDARRLLDDEAFYASMAQGISPYGDGKASERILDVLARRAR